MSNIYLIFQLDTKSNRFCLLGSHNCRIKAEEDYYDLLSQREKTDRNFRFALVNLKVGRSMSMDLDKCLTWR